MAEGPLSPAAYRYKALGERHIRLLKVPGSSKDAPAYDLIETSLDAAPPYETISYVWGKQNRSQILTFRTAETVRITPALQVTLSYLRFHCRTGYLWIDQICIDQSNTLECNQQVAIMGEIYGKAQRVLIWLGELGEEDDDSSHLTTLLAFAPTSTPHQNTFDHFSRKIEPLLKDGIDPANGYRRSSIRNLLTRPWFGRAWVVQEAVLSNTATCFLGTLAFDIEALWALVRAVRNAEDHKLADAQDGIRQLRGYLVLNEIIRLRHQRQDQRCFYYSLSTLAPRCRTSRPQDMIFAFLGLLDDPRIQVSPDYNMALDEIPAMATRAILAGTGSLDLFGVLHRYTEDQSRWSCLPSWVPDWSRRLKGEVMVFPGRSMYFDASRTFCHRGAVETLQTWSHMLVSGKVIDEVVHRIPFTEGIAAPASSRYGWEVCSYLDIHRLHETLETLWSASSSIPTRERILTTVLADGSFAFHKDERSKSRDGLSEGYTRKLLEAYESLKQPLSTQGSERKEASALRDYARIAWGRALIVGRQWRLGLAHEEVCKGDLICIVHGSKVPLVLRRVTEGHYCLIGQCYFEGVMRGEAVTWEERDADHFLLV